MVFTVVVAVTDITLSDAPKKAAIAMSKIANYAILVADTVIVQPAGSSGGASLVTDKAPSERLQVVYTLEEDEDEEAEKAAKVAARAAAAEAPTRATRGAAKKAEVEANMAERLQREQRQLELLKKRKDEARRKAGGDGDAAGGAGEKDVLATAPGEWWMGSRVLGSIMPCLGLLSLTRKSVCFACCQRVPGPSFLL